MNKSHITSDQVKSVLQMYWHADDPSRIFSQVDLQDMRRALEAAFPEQQPAAIKPIAFADRTPEDGSDVFIWHNEYKQWVFLSVYNGYEIQEGFTHWFPASALPIPEPAVDPMEAAWREYCSDWRSVGVRASRLDFLAGYEAGQAGGKQP